MRALQYDNLKMMAYFTGDYFYTLHMADKKNFILSMNQKTDLKYQSIYNHAYRNKLKYQIAIMCLSILMIFLSFVILCEL